jgi:hypothetical protein
MFISLSKRSLEQRFFFTPVIGVFVYHECTMQRHAEMGDVLTGKPGADPWFQVRGAHLKKVHRAEGGAKILGYFVWKITILRQKIIFFPIAEGGTKIFGVFRVKNHNFTPKNNIFPNFRGGRVPGAPPSGSAPVNCKKKHRIH